MILRATILVFAVLFWSGCEDKPSIKLGSVYTTGPTIDPDDKILANVITFHYEATDPEPVHLVVGGDRVKTVLIEGEVDWRIEVNDRQVKVLNGEPILEVTVAEEGTLDSKVSVNSSRQLVFDIAVGVNKVFRIECPEQLVDGPTKRNEAESGPGE